MDQVLEAALRRKPKALVAEPPQDRQRATTPRRPGAREAAPRPPDRRSRRPTSRRSSSAAVSADRAREPASAAQAPGHGLPGLLPILGVPRTATQAEIKKAFRKLAREHHPDAQARRQGRRARFKEINEANEVLSDPEKRKQVRPARRELGGVSAGPAPAAAGGGRRPVRAASPGGGPAGRQRPLRVPDVGGDARRVLRLLPDVLRRRRRADAGRGRARRGAAADRRPDVRGHPRPGWASTARGRGDRRRRPRAARPPRPAPADGRGGRRDHPRGGLPRHDPAGRGRRQAPRGHDPAAAPTPAPGSS